MVTPVNKCLFFSPEPSSSLAQLNPSLVYFCLMDLLVLRDSFVHQGSPHIVMCLCGLETAHTGTPSIHQDREGCLLMMLKDCEQPGATREEGLRVTGGEGGTFE